MGSKILWMLRRLFVYLLTLLRQVGSRGCGLLQRAYSVLLHLLDLQRSAPEERRHGGGPELETNLNPELELCMSLVTREATVCRSSVPQYIENSSSALTTTAIDGSREDTLVALPEEGRRVSQDARGGWLDKEEHTKSPSPHNSLGPLPEVAEDGIIMGSVDESKTPPELSQVVEDLYPVGVDESERYERGVTIPKGLFEGFVVIPYFTVGCTPPAVPPPWVRYVHPEGGVYFWDNSRRIVTDADISNSDVYDIVEDRLSQIQEYITNHNMEYPREKHVHLYLEHYPAASCFGYYFVDHAKQTLFWLDQKYGRSMVRKLQTPSPGLNHVGIELRAQYWYHNEYFPHLLRTSDETLSELQDILWYAVGDLLTSSTSTIPYTLEETKNMQSLVTEITAHYHDSSSINGSTRMASDPFPGGIDVGARTVIYRLLGNFTHERFINFYGENHARLNRDQSVFGETKRTWFMSLVSPVLFCAPEGYLRNVQSSVTDGLVNKPSWNKLLTKLTEEWKECTLYATVLLTSNVSFLAIQSLDELGSAGYRSPAQRVSYLSIAVSIGTITLGLLLTRQHHTTLKREFLANRSVTARGLETLAVMYSLPFILLMYGMITFFLAFSIMCYQSHDKITIGILTIAWITIVLLLVWCISTSFEHTIYEINWLRRRYNVLKELVNGRRKRWNFGKEQISERASV